MITRSRLRELQSHTFPHVAAIRGQVHYIGPEDVVDGIVGDCPPSSLQQKFKTSAAPWTFVRIPIQPHILIRKDDTGWHASWSWFGLDNTIDCTGTWEQLADLVRADYDRQVSEVAA